MEEKNFYSRGLERLSKYRRAARIDENQPAIVSALIKLGCSVEVGHDDILVGWQKKTYWYEIKSSEKAEVKDGQKELLETFKGHYKIVWTLDQILEDIGIIR